MERMGKNFIAVLDEVLLSKSHFLSLIYGALALDVPQALVKETDSKLLNIIRRNKPRYLKKGVLCKPCCQGGLNVLDFNTSNTILKIKWF